MNRFFKKVITVIWAVVIMVTFYPTQALAIEQQFELITNCMEVVNVSTQDALNEVKRIQEEKKRKQEELKKRQQEQKKWKALGKFYLTAYCDCSNCQEQWVGTTATGVEPIAGTTIAVDPRVIPLGSKIKIEGKQYIAQDVGGAIKGKHIDVLLGNHAATTKWHNRYAEVFIKVK